MHARPPESDMKTVGLTEAKAKFYDLVEEVRTGQPIVISKYGVKSAMMVSPEDYERLRKLHPEWPVVSGAVKAE